MLNKMSQRGFTLLEAIVSIFIVTVGVGGVFTLVNQTIGGTQAVSSKLTATYLAQEGIEVVRNIRDGNLLKIHKGIGGVSWDDGILTNVQRTSPCDFYGDLNSDGLVTSADTTIVMQCSGGGGTNCERGDVNGSGLPVNSLDINLMERYILGVDSTFSVCSSKAKFQRKTTVTSDGSDILKVSVEVSWQERGGSHKVIVQENLYNWLK